MTDKDFIATGYCECGYKISEVWSTVTGTSRMWCNKCCREYDIKPYEEHKHE